VSATYAVFGARDEAEARELVAEAVREEADEVRKSLGLDELAHRIAKTLAPVQAAIAGRNAAVAKARAIDGAKVDKIEADLEEIVAVRSELTQLGTAVGQLVARESTATRGARRYQ